VPYDRPTSKVNPLFFIFLFFMFIGALYSPLLWPPTKLASYLANIYLVTVRLVYEPTHVMIRKNKYRWRCHC
jgi:hypothetical protein